MHAFLSASNHHWVNYTPEKLADRWSTHREAARGTVLHTFAKMSIDLGIALPRTAQTLNMYVNDAIGFRMTTEQVLFYSENAFGTADAVSFRKNLLRIHDLKNGVSPASMMQLRIYAAFFCLEYAYNPNDIKFELRIYQNDEVMAEKTEPEDIEYVMERVIQYDRIISELKEQEGL